MKQGTLAGILASGVLQRHWCWGRSGGRTPRTPHIILYIYNHMNQLHSDTWHQWVGPRVRTLLAINDTCHHSIGQPPTNKNMPRLTPATSS
jgi:hypothetical protein